MRTGHTQRRTFAAILGAIGAAALVVAGCGGSDGEARAVPAAPPFVYDGTAALDFEQHVVGAEGIRDVSFSSGGDRIDGYLVLPRTSKRRPAVVFLHGAGGGREQLLDRAKEFAARGGVALTLTGPSSRATPPTGLGAADALDWQRDLAVRDVVAVRRAVDVLATLPAVDPARVGFVGWSAGARTGAILAGVEGRIDALVLMSGGAVPVQRYVEAAPPDVRFRVRTVLGQVDPLRYVARARPEALLLQDGTRDQIVPRHALVELARAAPPGTDVRWYDAGHELNGVAYVEQLDWLANRLELDRKPKRWRPSWR